MKSRYIAAINDKPWWLAGGIPRAACIAAYQPKGASDYAVSKTNLANPGTYDAADGSAYPTWDATNGWRFNGTDDYLDSGVIHSSNYTVICRFIRRSDTDAATQIFFGANTTNTRYYLGYSSNTVAEADRLRPVYGWGSASYNNLGATVAVNSGGVMCLADKKTYWNGSYVADVTATYTNTNTRSDYIGGYNNNGTAALFSGIDIYALAIYNATLTAQNIADLTTAMNAL